MRCTADTGKNFLSDLLFCSFIFAKSIPLFKKYQNTSNIYHQNTNTNLTNNFFLSVLRKTKLFGLN